MAEPEFLPCPFCGGTDIRTDRHRGQGAGLHRGEDVYSMACYHCGARFPNCYRRELFIEKWNRRAPAPDPLAAAQEPAQAWANVKEDGTIVGLSQHPADIARWVNPQPLYLRPPPSTDSAADARDAARYRWLRKAATFGGRDTFDLRWYLPRYGVGDSRERLDANIDEAIATATHKPNRE